MRRGRRVAVEDEAMRVSAAQARRRRRETQGRREAGPESNGGIETDRTHVSLFFFCIHTHITIYTAAFILIYIRSF
jgi:hypothetical protein